MVDDLHEGFLADAVPCPQCGVEPVWEEGELRWFHKHDCFLHWRRLREKEERARAKIERARERDHRRRRIDYWLYRWSIKDIIATVLFAAFVIFLILFFLGIVSLGE